MARFYTARLTMTNKTTKPSPANSVSSVKPAKPKPSAPAMSVQTDEDRYSSTAVKNAKKMAKRTYVADSPIHGKGLFAATAIKADVSLGRLHGMITEDEGTYVLWLNKKIGLEITNEFRFINHSSTPNCALLDTDVVTLKKIAKDEELTHDYGW